MTEAGRHRVVFMPAGREVVVDAATTVLDAARVAGVDLDSVCGGRGLCGRCQVQLSVGDFPKWAITADASSVTEPDATELDYRGARPLVPGQRLGCAARIVGDTVIDIPTASQIHRPVVRKSFDGAAIVVDPIVVLRYVEPETAHLGADTSFTALIEQAMRANHGCDIAAWRPRVLGELSGAVGAGTGVTVALRQTSADQTSADHLEAIAVLPGYVDSAYGVAIDVGSTTVAGHLCDLASGEVLASAGRMNPQIRLGEDLMSRVSYVMMHPEGREELTSLVRTALSELIGELCAEAGVDAAQVFDLVVVGNPVMCHLVLGIDPTPLGTAPFLLATDGPVTVAAADLGLDLPHADVYVGPAISGHVGADCAAAMLAEGPHRSATPQLLVDVGTNAEIVLGTSSWCLAASSPTGPAFEGAQLSCGQRATVGAIERVRIDRTTLEPRFKVIGSDLWSDDPAFPDDTRRMTISGVCGSGIIELIAELYLAGVIAADGTILGGTATRTPRVVADDRTFAYVLHTSAAGELRLTQNDVRAIQLAKAALRAGIDLLISHAGVGVAGPDEPSTGELVDIRLAGAFGAHIDPLYAMVLGMIPDAPLDGVRSVGNAAGVGAVHALLSGTLRRELETAVRNVARIETATEPEFQRRFIDAMGFPDDPAASPNLATLVALPQPVAAGSRDASGRRRRRPTRSSQTLDRPETNRPETESNATEAPT